MLERKGKDVTEMENEQRKGCEKRKEEKSGTTKSLTGSKRTLGFWMEDVCLSLTAFIIILSSLFLSSMSVLLTLALILSYSLLAYPLFFLHRSPVCLLYFFLSRFLSSCHLSFDCLCFCPSFFHLILSSFSQ